MAGFNLKLETKPGKPAGHPFKPALVSIFDAATGPWQKRKADWLALGIKSELGRGGFGNFHENDGTSNVDHYREKEGTRQAKEVDEAKLTRDMPIARLGKYLAQNEKYRPTMATTTVCATDWMKRGTDAGGSVFNPALCEALYLHYTQPGWVIRDPFAGGSVRGIVAAGCDRIYHGMELRDEQVHANRLQAEEICNRAALMPQWVIGDSRGILEAYPEPCDFVFSCPPYGDLEVYSDRPEDISAVGWDGFVPAYRDIIAKTCSTLKNNRFACFVVGNFRDQKTGFYRDLVGETISAFAAAGMAWVDDMVLVTPRGSLPIRATKQFQTTRKAGKTHQNILVFCKGDPELAAIAAAGK